MFNVVLIQKTTEGVARNLFSYETYEQAKSKVYTELAEITISPILLEVRAMILDDDLSTLMFQSNALTPVVDNNNEEEEES